MSVQNTLKRRATMLLAMTILLLAGCADATQSGTDTEGVTTGDGAVVVQADLTEQLQARGATVETGGTVEQPFFSVPGQVLIVNGMEVQVFEYETEGMRSGESGAISPDGQVGTTMITWIDTPHFWATGRLIVLYVGSDQATIDLLSDMLGEQITQA